MEMAHFWLKLESKYSVYSLKNQLNRAGCNYSKFDFEKSSPVGHGARVAKSLRRGRKRCLRGCGGRANDTRRNFGGGRRLKVVKRRRHESRLNDISGRSGQALFRYFFFHSLLSRVPSGQLQKLYISRRPPPQ